MTDILSRTVSELSQLIVRISHPRGHFDPKFQVEGVAPTNHSSSQKTRLNVLSYGLKIWTDLSTVLSQITRVTDGQTDGQTDRNLVTIPRLHYMQSGKNHFYSPVGPCACNRELMRIWVLNRAYQHNPPACAKSARTTVSALWCRHSARKQW